MKKAFIFLLITVVVFLISLSVALADFKDELTDEDRAKDEQIFATIDDYKPISEYQIRYRSGSDLKKGKIGTDGGGLCNISAITTLLNRRLAADYICDSFSVEDVLASLGCREITTDHKLYSGTKGETKGEKWCQYYSFSTKVGSGTTKYWGTGNYKKGSYSYGARLELSNSGKPDGIKNKLHISREDMNAYFAMLLHKNPEGIAVHAFYKSKQHTVVIHKYTYSEGKYTLYIKDPRYPDKSIKLSGSAFEKNHGGDFYKYCDMIVCLKGKCSMSTDININKQMISPTKVEIDKTTFALKNHFDTESLEASIIPSNASNQKVTWKSSDPSVATVDSNGTVTAVAPGTAIITVTTVDGGKTATCTVTVGNDKISVVKDNLDAYYLAVGVNSDSGKSSSGFGLVFKALYGGSATLPTYSDPDENSRIISNHSVLTCFHVTALLDNDGTEWYQLEDGSYIQAKWLNPVSILTTVTDVQKGLYEANADGARFVRNPYFNSDEDAGTLAKGTQINVFSAVKTQVLWITAKTWYRAKYNNEEIWVSPDEFTFVGNRPTISISGAKYPQGERRKGVGFELMGKITASENIASVTGSVYNQSTGALVEFSTKKNPAVINPNTKSVEIYHTAVNTSLKFGELPPGTYRYELKAKTSSGYEETLVDKVFTIVGDEDLALGDEFERIPVETMNLSTDSIDLDQDDCYRIVAVLTPDEATNQDVQWTSSDPAIVTVDSHGIARAVGVGTATITATATDGSGVSKQVTVTTKSAEASAAGLEYEIRDGEAYVTGCTISGVVRIPETIEGCPVVSIRGLSGEGITSIYIPKTVTDMFATFFQDETLEYAYFAEGATVVPPQAFQLSSLRYVYLPDSITEIGYYAFNACNLTYVNLPANLKLIDICAFMSNEDLSDVELPSGLEEIGDNAFAHTNIKSITIPKSVQSMAGAFWSCDSLISASFEEGTTTICPQAMRHAHSLQFVDIPESVTTISYNAFDSCSSLSEIVLPSGLTHIEGQAFSYTSLSSIAIPSSVIKMDGAFNYCDTLSDVYFGDGMTAVPDSALEGYTSIDYVYIPDTITRIGEEAFKGCTSLTEVELPTGLQEIGSSAFAETGISSIVLPDGLTTIDYSAFEDCANLSNVTLPDSIKEMNSWAFKGTALTSVRTPACWAIIAPIFLGDEIASPFAGCKTLTNIEVPEGVQELPDYAFGDNSECSSASIKKVTLPYTLTQIGYRAFAGTGLTDVYYGGTENAWQLVHIDDGNDPLFNATMHYGDWEPEPEDNDWEPGMVLPGDTNGDGLVDGRDTIRLMNYLAGETDEETGLLIRLNLKNADVNADGKVDELDLIRMVKYLGGEDVTLAEGTALTIHDKIKDYILDPEGKTYDAWLDMNGDKTIDKTDYTLAVEAGY